MPDKVSRQRGSVSIGIYADVAAYQEVVEVRVTVPYIVR